MNKLSSILLVGVVTLFMSSCFLFRSHEDCPAYGSNIKEKNVKQVDDKTEQTLLIEGDNRI